jgi:hypothetical protein
LVSIVRDFLVPSGALAGVRREPIVPHLRWLCLDPGLSRVNWYDKDACYLLHSIYAYGAALIVVSRRSSFARSGAHCRHKPEIDEMSGALRDWYGGSGGTRMPRSGQPAESWW